MKAKELLKLYTEGRRDFRSQDLRGLSFKGKDLSGADFSGSDITGTEFSWANLTGSKFVGVQAGLPALPARGLLSSACLLLALGICCIFFMACFIAVFIFSDKNEFIFSGEIEKIITSGIIIFIILGINFFFIYQGLKAVTINVAIIFVFAIARVIYGLGFLKIAENLTGVITRAGNLTGIITGVITGIGLFTISLFLFVFLFVFLFTVAFTVAFAIALVRAGGVAIPVTILFTLTLTFIVTKAEARAGTSVFARAIGFTGARAIAAELFIFMVTFLLMFLYFYIGWRAMEEDSKDVWIRTIAVAFAATGGTTFYEANLIDADFTKATLKNTNFIKATLTRTCFRGTNKLDLVRPGNTYLKNLQVQKLLQTGEGQDKNFDNQDLTGINLQESNLVDASFIGANLKQANFQYADLSRAKLVQTKLDQTDFTGAILTGAYIEDWTLTRSTKFDHVKCEYVYMRLPTKYNPDPLRKPDNNKEVFADGEFGDFIKPIVDTLDLYHTQNIDPRAIAIALRNLAENNPDAQMTIKAMEKKGNNFLIRLATSPQGNRSQLSAEYFNNYNEIKALSERQQALLLEKDDRINSYENMIGSLINKPTLYAENYHNQGDTMSDKSSDFKFGNVGGDVVGVAGGDISGVAGKDQTGVAGGDISGTVTASIGQLTESEAPEAHKLAELLKQLQSAIASDTHLSEKDKAKALKQVQALAEAGQNPKDEDKKDLADTAITMLKGVVSGLPVIAAVAKACQELLPLITPFFGL